MGRKLKEIRIQSCIVGTDEEPCHIRPLLLHLVICFHYQYNFGGRDCSLFRILDFSISIRLEGEYRISNNE